MRLSPQQSPNSSMAQPGNRLNKDYFISVSNNGAVNDFNLVILLSV